MLLRKHSVAFLLGLMAATTSLASVACSSSSEEDTDTGALVDEPTASGFEMDLAAVNAKWPAAGFAAEKAEDVFSVLVQLENGKSFRANTHLFTKSVNVIPYANPDIEASVAGATDGRGDAVIAQYIQPGEVGLMIKHHRPEHRVLALGGGGPEMKENFKLQDTHIGIIVGVERNGKPGAISINNPKGYESGAFGKDHYPMVFVKPTFPAGVDAATQKLYVDNIRSMAVLFNTVSTFPGDYNGGDPLAARTPDEIKRHVAMMVKAIGGDTNAQAWFTKPENLIYCAELAEVAFSAGILVPLTKSAIVGLDGDGFKINEADWSAFERAVSTGWPFAAAGTPSADTTPPNARLAEVAQYKPDFAAMSRLRPISELAALPKRADGLPAAGLAFEPMTMADIVQQFFRTHIPRAPERQRGSVGAPANMSLEGMGEEVAPIQQMVLVKMEEGLYESMKIPKEGQGSEQRQRKIDDGSLMELPKKFAERAITPQDFTVKDVFDGLVKIIGVKYGSYTEFQKALQPWLLVARKVTSPRASKTGDGLFSPPSLYHSVAQRDEQGNSGHPGGYLGLQYLGHGVHYTLVKQSSRVSTPAAETPAAGGGAAPAQQSDRKAPAGPPANPCGNP